MLPVLQGVAARPPGSQGGEPRASRDADESSKTGGKTPGSPQARKSRGSRAAADESSSPDKENVGAFTTPPSGPRVAATGGSPPQQQPQHPLPQPLLKLRVPDFAALNREGNRIAAALTSGEMPAKKKATLSPFALKKRLGGGAAPSPPRLPAAITAKLASTLSASSKSGTGLAAAGDVPRDEMEEGRAVAVPRISDRIGGHYSPFVAKSVLSARGAFAAHHPQDPAINVLLPGSAAARRVLHYGHTISQAPSSLAPEARATAMSRKIEADDKKKAKREEEAAAASRGSSRDEEEEGEGADDDSYRAEQLGDGAFLPLYLFDNKDFETLDSEDEAAFDSAFKVRLELTRAPSDEGATEHPAFGIGQHRGLGATGQSLAEALVAETEGQLPSLPSAVKRSRMLRPSHPSEGGSEQSGEEGAAVVATFEGPLAFSPLFLSSGAVDVGANKENGEEEAGEGEEWRRWVFAPCVVLGVERGGNNDGEPSYRIRFLSDKGRSLGTGPAVSSSASAPNATGTENGSFQSGKMTDEDKEEGRAWLRFAVDAVKGQSVSDNSASTLTVRLPEDAVTGKEKTVRRVGLLFPTLEPIRLFRQRRYEAIAARKTAVMGMKWEKGYLSKCGQRLLGPGTATGSSEVEASQLAKEGTAAVERRLKEMLARAIRLRQPSAVAKKAATAAAAALSEQTVSGALGFSFLSRPSVPPDFFSQPNQLRAIKERYGSLLSLLFHETSQQYVRSQCLAVERYRLLNPAALQRHRAAGFPNPSPAMRARDAAPEGPLAFLPHVLAAVAGRKARFADAQRQLRMALSSVAMPSREPLEAVFDVFQSSFGEGRRFFIDDRLPPSATLRGRTPEDDARQEEKERKAIRHKLMRGLKLRQKAKERKLRRQQKLERQRLAEQEGRTLSEDEDEPLDETKDDELKGHGDNRPKRSGSPPRGSILERLINAAHQTQPAQQEQDLETKHASGRNASAVTATTAGTGATTAIYPCTLPDWLLRNAEACHELAGDIDESLRQRVVTELHDCFSKASAADAPPSMLKTMAETVWSIRTQEDFLASPLRPLVMKAHGILRQMIRTLTLDSIERLVATLLWTSEAANTALTMMAAADAQGQRQHYSPLTDITVPRWDSKEALALLTKAVISVGSRVGTVFAEPRFWEEAETEESLSARPSLLQQPPPQPQAQSQPVRSSPYKSYTSASAPTSRNASPGATSRSRGAVGRISTAPSSPVDSPGASARPSPPASPTHAAAIAVTATTNNGALILVVTPTIQHKAFDEQAREKLQKSLVLVPAVSSAGSQASSLPLLDRLSCLDFEADARSRSVHSLLTGAMEGKRAREIDGAIPFNFGRPRVSLPVASRPCLFKVRLVPNAAIVAATMGWLSVPDITKQSAATSDSSAVPEAVFAASAGILREKQQHGGAASPINVSFAVPETLSVFEPAPAHIVSALLATLTMVKEAASCTLGIEEPLFGLASSHLQSQPLLSLLPRQNETEQEADTESLCNRKIEDATALISRLIQLEMHRPSLLANRFVSTFAWLMTTSPADVLSSHSVRRGYAPLFSVRFAPFTSVEESHAAIVSGIASGVLIPSASTFQPTLAAAFVQPAEAAVGIEEPTATSVSGMPSFGSSTSAATISAAPSQSPGLGGRAGSRSSLLALRRSSSNLGRSSSGIIGQQNQQLPSSSQQSLASATTATAASAASLQAAISLAVPAVAVDIRRADPFITRFAVNKAQLSSIAGKAANVQGVDDASASFPFGHCKTVAVAGEWKVIESENAWQDTKDVVLASASSAAAHINAASASVLFPPAPTVAGRALPASPVPKKQRHHHQHHASASAIAVAAAGGAFHEQLAAAVALLEDDDALDRRALDATGAGRTGGGGGDSDAATGLAPSPPPSPLQRKPSAPSSPKRLSLNMKSGSERAMAAGASSAPSSVPSSAQPSGRGGTTKTAVKDELALVRRYWAAATAAEKMFGVAFGVGSTGDSDPVKFGLVSLDCSPIAAAVASHARSIAFALIDAIIGDCLSITRRTTAKFQHILRGISRQPQDSEGLNTLRTFVEQELGTTGIVEALDRILEETLQRLAALSEEFAIALPPSLLTEVLRSRLWPSRIDAGKRQATQYLAVLSERLQRQLDEEKRVFERELSQLPQSIRDFYSIGGKGLLDKAMSISSAVAGAELEALAEAGEEEYGSEEEEEEGTEETPLEEAQKPGAEEATPSTKNDEEKQTAATAEGGMPPGFKGHVRRSSVYSTGSAAASSEFARQSKEFEEKVQRMTAAQARQLVEKTTDAAQNLQDRLEQALAKVEDFKAREKILSAAPNKAEMAGAGSAEGGQQPQARVTIITPREEALASPPPSSQAAHHHHHHHHRRASSSSVASPILHPTAAASAASAASAPSLESLAADWKPFFSLWSALGEFEMASREKWLAQSLRQLNVGEMARQVTQWLSEATKLQHLFKQRSLPAPYTVASSLKHRITAFKELLPVIEALASKAMRPEHWAQIARLLEQPDLEEEEDAFAVGSGSGSGGSAFTASDLLEMGILAFSDRIQEISAVAGKQFALERQLEAMRKELGTAAFKLAPYKTTGTFIVRGVDEISALIDDQLIRVTSILSSPYAAKIAESCRYYEQRLLSANTLIERWMAVQRSWMYLEPIFGYEDIATALPNEAKRFNTVDALLKRTMTTVHQEPKVNAVLEQPSISTALGQASERLEEITRALTVYLELKRQAFPRFFFLSNDELLSILSETRDPKRVQPHLGKTFEGIASVDFSPSPGTASAAGSVPISTTREIGGAVVASARERWSGGDVITAMTSPEGEKVVLAKVVDPGLTKGLVEIWMGRLEASMRLTVKESIRAALTDYVASCLPAVDGSSLPSDASREAELSTLLASREQWLVKWPAQVVLAVEAIVHTFSVEKAIRQFSLAVSLGMASVSEGASLTAGTRDFVGILAPSASSTTVGGGASAVMSARSIGSTATATGGLPAGFSPVPPQTERSARGGVVDSSADEGLKAGVGGGGGGAAFTVVADPHALSSLLYETNEKISSMVRMVRSPDLPPLARATITALTTISVHSRDVIEALVKARVSSESAFEWISQLRYYWDAEGTWWLPFSSSGSASSSASSFPGLGGEEGGSSLVEIALAAALSPQPSSSSSGTASGHSRKFSIASSGAAARLKAASAAGQLSSMGLGVAMPPPLHPPEDPPRLNVKVFGTSLPYAHEYLGNTTRLVLTPLTDRCYRTLLSAVSLNYGGAPQGPAGTGKTETTKDLAKALATQCIVFNCSDALNVSAMAKFFKGLAGSGAWSCFDEFNRINIEVLSVVAQQILTLNRAKREGARRVTLQGSSVVLHPRCQVFVTMNPGYAGRAELPDNLKALFRPVAMMMPDYALIAEISLFSAGFEKARAMARKIVQILRLSSEQLSSQDHYDYGMRAVKTILNAAAILRQRLPDKSEEEVTLRAIRDANVPKFVAADLPLFEAIVADLFPSQAASTEEPDALLRHAIVSAANSAALGLQPDDAFVEKTLELYHLISVRHGVCLVGEAMTSKTSVLKTLAHALTSLAERTDIPTTSCLSLAPKPVSLAFINPKSISSRQLYGEYDTNTRDYDDGVLSRAIRVFASGRSSGDEGALKLAEGKEGEKEETRALQWVVLDGPIDAIWVENLNTVLDDNKKLCLTSGEIIKLTPTMTMVFETDSLHEASPATVSRLGVVFFDSTAGGGADGLPPWKRLVLSWLENDVPEDCEGVGSDSHKQHVSSLFDWAVPSLLYMVVQGQKKRQRPGKAALSMLTPLPPSSLVSSLIAAFSAMLRESGVKLPHHSHHHGSGDDLLAGTVPSEIDDPSLAEALRGWRSRLPKEDLERLEATERYRNESIFIFALAWSFGAVLTQESRGVFDATLGRLLKERAGNEGPCRDLLALLGGQRGNVGAGIRGKGSEIGVDEGEDRKVSKGLSIFDYRLDLQSMRVAHDAVLAVKANVLLLAPQRGQLRSTRTSRARAGSAFFPSLGSPAAGAAPGPGAFFGGGTTQSPMRFPAASPSAAQRASLIPPPSPVRHKLPSALTLSSSASPPSSPKRSPAALPPSPAHAGLGASSSTGAFPLGSPTSTLAERRAAEKVQREGLLVELLQHRVFWSPWRERLQSIPGTNLCPIPSSLRFFEIVVPTAETVSRQELLSLFVRQGINVLIAGPSGTAKTLSLSVSVVTAYDTATATAAAGSASRWLPISLQLTAKTSSGGIQTTVDSKLSKRRVGVYSAPLGKRCLLMVDDLNVPQREAYGAQPPIELLRQLVDQGGWYSTGEKGKPWRRILGTQILAAVGTGKGGDRDLVNGRLIRHFLVQGWNAFAADSLARIFGSILHSHLLQGSPLVPSSSQPAAVALQVVASVVELFSSLSGKLRPTPAKPFYAFSLRDVVKVVAGVCSAPSASIATAQQLVRLAGHECLRVFGDRLVDDADRVVLETILGSSLKRNCKDCPCPDWADLRAQFYLEQQTKAARRATPGAPQVAGEGEGSVSEEGAAASHEAPSTTMVPVAVAPHALAATESLVFGFLPPAAVPSASAAEGSRDQAATKKAITKGKGGATGGSKATASAVYRQATSDIELQGYLNRALDQYNRSYQHGGHHRLDLVLFRAAREHAIRIARALSSSMATSTSSLSCASPSSNVSFGPFAGSGNGRHVLLLGVGGSGRRSLTRLAAFLCGLPLKELETRGGVGGATGGAGGGAKGGYNVNDWRDDLKAVLLKAAGVVQAPLGQVGVAANVAVFGSAAAEGSRGSGAGGGGGGMVFLVPDTAISFDSQLEDLNTLLNGAEVQGLFGGEDEALIVSSLLGEAKAAVREEQKRKEAEAAANAAGTSSARGGFGSSREDEKEGRPDLSGSPRSRGSSPRAGGTASSTRLAQPVILSNADVMAFFQRKAASGLRIVLTMSPHAKNFRERLRAFPAIVGRCWVSYFSAWPLEALSSVGRRLLGMPSSLPDLVRQGTPALGTAIVAGSSQGAAFDTLFETPAAALFPAAPGASTVVSAAASKEGTSATDQTLLDAVVGICVSMQQTASDLASQFALRERRTTHVTPSSYLQLIRTFAALLVSKRKLVAQQEKRYRRGVSSIENAEALVTTMQASLTEMQPVLTQAREDTAALMKTIQQQQSEADATAQQTEREKAACAVQAEDASKLAKECEESLAKALPALEAAKEALKQLKASDIAEMKAMKQPPAGVRLVMASICVLLGIQPDKVKGAATGPAESSQPAAASGSTARAGTGGGVGGVGGGSGGGSGPPSAPGTARGGGGGPTDSAPATARGGIGVPPAGAPSAMFDFWGPARKLLGQADFLRQLFEFDRDTLTDERASTLESVYVSDPDYSNEKIARSSVAAEGLASFVRAMVAYHRASADVAPKRAALEEARESLDSARAALIAKEERLAEVLAAVAELKRSLDEANAKKLDLEAQQRHSQLKLDRAQQLIARLGGEKERWREKASDYARRGSALIGDMLLSSGFITYLGPFTAPYRERAVSLWSEALLSQSSLIPSTLSLDIAAAAEATKREAEALATAAAQAHDDASSTDGSRPPTATATATTGTVTATGISSGHPSLIPAGPPVFSLRLALSDEVTVAAWTAGGLPSDGFSVENAILLFNSPLWPFLIDPDRQALNWIKASEAGGLPYGAGSIGSSATTLATPKAAGGARPLPTPTKAAAAAAKRPAPAASAASPLRIVRLDSPGFARAVSQAVMLGLPLLVEKLDESSIEGNRFLDPLLLRQVTRTPDGSGGYALSVRLGSAAAGAAGGGAASSGSPDDAVGSGIEYNPSFRLYLATETANPKLGPELRSRVNLLAFGATREGLTEQLLAATVAQEVPSLEQERQHAVKETAATNAQLAAIEAEILKLLAEASGDLLEDEGLISTLRSSSEVSKQAHERIAQAERTNKRIMTTRQEYLPLAQRASTVFFVVASLSGVQQMYQWSLGWFSRVFLSSLATLSHAATKGKTLSSRIRSLIEISTAALHRAVKVTLFQKDRLLFSLLLALRVLESEGHVAASEIRFFLDGAAVPAVAAPGASAALGIEERQNPATSLEAVNAAVARVAGSLGGSSAGADGEALLAAASTCLSIAAVGLGSANQPFREEDEEEYDENAESPQKGGRGKKGARGGFGGDDKTKERKRALSAAHRHATEHAWLTDATWSQLLALASAIPALAGIDDEVASRLGSWSRVATAKEPSVEIAELLLGKQGAALSLSQGLGSGAASSASATAATTRSGIVAGQQQHSARGTVAPHTATSAAGAMAMMTAVGGTATGSSLLGGHRMIAGTKPQHRAPLFPSSAAAQQRGQGGAASHRSQAGGSSRPGSADSSSSSSSRSGTLAAATTAASRVVPATPSSQKAPAAPAIPPGRWSHLTAFHHLLLVKVFRPDKLLPLCEEFVLFSMGRNFMADTSGIGQAVPATAATSSKPAAPSSSATIGVATATSASPSPGGASGGFDLGAGFAETAPDTPLVFILSPGADPSADLLRLADAKGFGRKLRFVSLGQGQGEVAESAIAKATEEGVWVCLHNCHLAASWLPRLESLVEEAAAGWAAHGGSDDHGATGFRGESPSRLPGLSGSSGTEASSASARAGAAVGASVVSSGGSSAGLGSLGKDGTGDIHPDFRLFLFSAPHPAFPVSVLQRSVKLTSEAPKGLKNSLLSSFTSLMAAESYHDDCAQPKAYRRLFFSLCFFHAVVQERRRYGPLGYNESLSFAESDLSVSIAQLRVALDEAAPPDAFAALALYRVNKVAAAGFSTVTAEKGLAISAMEAATAAGLEATSIAQLTSRRRGGGSMSPSKLGAGGTDEASGYAGLEEGSDEEQQGAMDPWAGIPSVVPFATLRYLVSSCFYGGRINDNHDARTVEALLNLIFNEQCLTTDKYRLSESGRYFVPEDGPLSSYLNVIRSLPGTMEEGAEIVGLSENAEIATAVTDARVLLEAAGRVYSVGGAGGAPLPSLGGSANGGSKSGAITIAATARPQQGASKPLIASGRSSVTGTGRRRPVSTAKGGALATSVGASAVVGGGVGVTAGLASLAFLRFLSDLLERQIPCELDEEAAAERFPVSRDRSMNTVLIQECSRFNRLLEAVRGSIKMLSDAVQGLAVLTPDLEVVAAALQGGRVPPSWLVAGYPSLKPLASWCTDLRARIAQLTRWIERKDRSSPPLFWLPGFFFPQGFLTAVLQDHARKNKRAIDTLTLECHVLSHVSVLDARLLAGASNEDEESDDEDSSDEDDSDGEGEGEDEPIVDDDGEGEGESAKGAAEKKSSAAAKAKKPRALPAVSSAYRQAVERGLPDVAVAPKEGDGVYIFGLFLEGAAWNVSSGTLSEQAPQQLYCPFPAVWLRPTVVEGRADADASAVPGSSPLADPETASGYDDAASGSAGGSLDPAARVQAEKRQGRLAPSGSQHHPRYLCPVYRTAERRGTLSTTGHSTSFIFSLSLPFEARLFGETPDHWVKRGTALLLEEPF